MRPAALYFAVFVFLSWSGAFVVGQAESGVTQAALGEDAREIASSSHRHQPTIFLSGGRFMSTFLEHELK